jgi:DNA adenine methylase
MTFALPETTALLQYFGTNRMLAHTVGKELAGCDWVGVTFAGGMTELPYIGARSLWVNDAHRHVINLARTVADKDLGPQVYRRLRRMAFHPDELKEAQRRCVARDAQLAAAGNLYGDGNENAALLDPVGWSVDYFAATWMARAGQAGTDGEFRGGLSVRYDAGGGGSAVRFRSATRSLIQWRRVLERAEFSTLDCFEFLAKVKDCPGHGIYNDPPFPDAGDAYRHKFTPDMHRRLAETLAGFKAARVACRFYDHPLVRELYPESRWTWRRMGGGRKQTNEAAPEVLLLNGPSYVEAAA